MNNEFVNISNYLLNVNTVPSEISHEYKKAIEILECDLDNYESKVWFRMQKNKLLFTIYDGGFALIKPHSPIRKRILVAMAILECSPDYMNYFISEKANFKIVTSLIINIPFAIFSGLLGALLVQFKL